MFRKTENPTTQILALALSLGLSFLVLTTAVQSSSKPKSAEQNQTGSSTDQIQQGKYLVHHVAMCIQCHTPKNSEGNLVESKLLQGSPIPVENPYPQQEWALQAPKLAGLPGGWSEEELAKFLEAGQAPSEHHIHPPMPPYRLKKTDAKAVAAYLKSLGTNR